jgi:DNA-binding SARP family transcriptional activator/WD40 repeat protein
MTRVGATTTQTEAVVSRRAGGGVASPPADGLFGAGGPRLRRLLALLVIRHGQTVTIDWLAEHLWSDGDRPDEYATRLRTYLSRLRQSLPQPAAEWIATEAGGYRMVAPTEAIEHVRFGVLRTRAREARDDGDPLIARGLLDDALALWRGEPFRELEDLDWARAVIEQLQLDRLEMLEERWETELDLGRHTQITGDLGSFLSEHPLRERAARQCAVALHRCGRTAEALRVLSTFRRRLADETGLEPSTAVVDLERSLLDGDPSLDAPDGRPLRGYRLVEEVGAGAFAVVWRASQPSVDRDVAIKQIRPEFASRPDFIRRFEAEARLIARIEHPHIVPLIDFWRDPGSAYLVMRWLGGDTLERWLDDGPLPAGNVLALAEQIGGALSAAHDHGVIHRDVKPSNILFDRAGHAYLTDFGIALASADGPEAALSPGTPAYAAPEQVRGEPAGPGADVYGLGAVLYECLVGSPLRGSVGESLDPLRHPPFSEARSRVESIPQPMAEAIIRATKPDPADRFASVAEFVLALGGTPGRGDARTEPERHLPTENPYVGLRAFDEGDAARFFGRDRLVEEIVDPFAGSGLRSRCVVVVGPSGSGKSSVVRAGVVPALRRGAAPGSGEWFTTTMVPDDDVYASLESALLRVAVDPPLSLHDDLRDGERGILRGVRRCVANGHLVLVIDQLEELFTANDAATADCFLAALSVAVDDPSSPLRLVATIRADHYDRPLRHPSFARIVKNTAVEVTPLAADELVEAITGPAHRVGVAFEPGVVAQMIADTAGSTSPLPLLQFALSELFDQRVTGREISAADYETVCGLAGALARRAERLFAEADPSERSAIRHVLGRLANPNDADTRRRVPVADLGDDVAIRRVIDRFGQARLLTFDRDESTREPTVEVAHEALLREWPRAAAWLEEDHELRRTAGSIGSAADAWDRGGRQAADLYRSGRLEAARDLASSNPEWLRPVDREFVDASHASTEADRRTELRRVRRLRRLVTATAVALVAALLAGGLAFVQQRRADREARAAEAAAEEAELATILTRSAAIAANDPQVALLLSLEARHRSPGVATDRALLDSLAASGLGRQVGVMQRLPGHACDSDRSSASIGPDGLREFGVDGDQLLVKDLVTGEIAPGGAAPARCVTWAEDPETGHRWAMAEQGDRQWSGLADGPWAEAQVSTRDTLLGDYRVEAGDLPPGGPLHANSVGGRLLYWQDADPRAWGPPNPAPVIVDARTLQRVGPIVPGITLDATGTSVEPVTASSETGGLFAVSGRPNGPDDPAGAGQVVVLDARNGAEVFGVRRSVPVTAVAFDRQAQRLLIGTADGLVEVIDLDSHDVVANAAMSESEPVIAIGSRPDGDIVAVSRQTVELFDDAGTARGLPVPIPMSDEARVRPNGTVVVVPRSDPETIRVIDPTGGPLVDTGWAVDPSALVAFGALRAGVVQSVGDVEFVDLDAGERQPVVSERFDGRWPEIAVAVPQSNGFLAWDRAGSFVRWRDGAMVAQLDLGSAGDVTLSRDAQEPSRRGSLLNVGTGAATLFLNGIPETVQRFDTALGALDVISTIDSPPRATVAAAPAPEGGIHLLLDDGVVRTYDATARSVGEVSTSVDAPWLVVSDPITGLVAVGGERGAAVVDPEEQTSTHIDDIGPVASLTFVRDGELLVMVEGDGSVLLWDVDRSGLIGTLWTGDGNPPQATPWYDASTDSVWVATSGTLLRFSLDSDRWAERLCDLVGRELTADEWHRFVPGDAPQRAACG